MAIEWFEEGLSRYLAQEAKASNKIVAGNLALAAKLLKDPNAQAQEEAGATLEFALAEHQLTQQIRAGLEQVRDYCNKIRGVFTNLGVTPPAIDFTHPTEPALPEQDISHQPEDSSPSLAEIEMIRQALGHPDRFDHIGSHILEMPLEQLGLPDRLRNVLKRAQFSTVGQLLEMTPGDLLEIRRFGNKSLYDLVTRLVAHSVIPRELSEDSPEEYLEDPKEGFYRGPRDLGGFSRD